MQWADHGDVCKKDDLSNRAGTLQTWLFLKRMIAWVQRKYIFRGDNTAICDAIQKVYGLWDNPMLWNLNESSDQTWQSALPLPLQKLHSILTNLFLGKYNQSLKSLLANTLTSALKPEDYVACKEVQPSWAEFEKIYRKYIGEPDDEAVEITETKKKVVEEAKGDAGADTLEKLQSDATIQANQFLKKQLVIQLQ